MIKAAAKAMKMSEREIRSNIAKLAHQISKAGHEATQSAAWKRAWAEFKKIAAKAIEAAREITLEEKLNAIISNSNIGSWAYNFATDNAYRVMTYGDKAKFSDKQIAKIEELYEESK